MSNMPTYLTDPYASKIETTVADVRQQGDGTSEIRLADTVFHPLGGGQPADTGEIVVAGAPQAVIDVRQDDKGNIWHVVVDGTVSIGEDAVGVIDWERRYRLMRTHTAAHVTIAVIARDFDARVTGCDMAVLSARIDFDNLPGGVAADIEAAVNEALTAELDVSFELLAREAAMNDPDLVRTKTNLVPTHVDPVRVVIIAGLDRQADGGTHVRNTREVGKVRVVKVENKGRGLRRARIEVLDA